MIQLFVTSQALALSRDPLVTALAIAAIVVAGAAGFWVYRTIRRGL